MFAFFFLTRTLGRRCGTAPGHESYQSLSYSCRPNYIQTSRARTIDRPRIWLRQRLHSFLVTGLLQLPCAASFSLVVSFFSPAVAAVVVVVVIPEEQPNDVRS